MSTEWLTRWPALAAAGGAVAIAGFAAVLLMRAESSPPKNDAKPPAAASVTTRATAPTTPNKNSGGTSSSSNGSNSGGTSSSGGKNGDNGTIAPPAESTDVRVLLTGPYAFSVVDEAGRSIAGPSQKHDLRLAPKTGFIVQAPQVYLKQKFVVENKPGGIMNVKVPAVGELVVWATTETCPVLLDGENIGFPPTVARRVVAGRHTVVLKCPDGDNQTESVMVTAGEKETLRIK